MLADDDEAPVAVVDAAVVDAAIGGTLMSESMVTDAETLSVDGCSVGEGVGDDVALGDVGVAVMVVFADPEHPAPIKRIVVVPATIPSREIDVIERREKNETSARGGRMFGKCLFCSLHCLNDRVNIGANIGAQGLDHVHVGLQSVEVCFGGGATGDPCADGFRRAAE